MKRPFILWLAGLALLLMLAGCGQKEEPQTQTPGEDPAAETMTEDAAKMPDSTMITDSTRATDSTTIPPETGGN